MAKICPFTNDVVLYLDCKECDDTEECRKLKYAKEENATSKTKEKEEDEGYEK